MIGLRKALQSIAKRAVCIALTFALLFCNLRAVADSQPYATPANQNENILILLEKGYDLFAEGNRKEAIAAFEQASSLAKALDNATITEYFKELIKSASRYNEIIAEFGEKSQNQTPAAKTQEAKLCLDLSILNEEFGNLQAAIRLSLKSAEIAEKIHERVLLEYALGDLGRQCNAIGNYAVAIIAFKKAIAIFQDQKDQTDSEAILLTELADAYAAKNDIGAAIDADLEAKNLYIKLRDKSGEASVLNSLKNLYDRLKSQGSDKPPIASVDSVRRQK